MTGLPQSEIDDLMRTAHALADAAGDVTLSYFRGSALSAENKDSDGFDPVTQADTAAERVMRDILARERPDDGVLGEEYGETIGASGLTWVLDPIDGTRGFLSGTPTWGILISVSDASGPLFGIIDQPYTRERFVGGFGISEMTYQGDPKPLGVRKPRPLDQAILFSTFPEVGSAQEGAAFRKVAEQAKLVRYGTDCYAYALLAAGQIDLVIEAGLYAYDICAPIAVIEAAGGVVTDWEGGPVHDGGRVVAAGSASLHTEALQLLHTVVGQG